MKILLYLLKFNLDLIWDFKIFNCPHCNESKLEKYISNVLIGANLEFERQKNFNWLGRQSLDFYLPKYNIAIECQGEQHYVDCYFSKKHRRDANLQYRIKLDEKKLKLCNEHNIKVLYYSNKQYKDDIIIDENKLLREIKRNDL